MRTFLVGLLCLFLPESHREGWVRSYSVNAPLWSFVFGIIELVGGLTLLMDRGFDHSREFASAPAGWDELVTIKVGDRFYQLIDVEERYHGGWKVVAHILEELGEDEPIRRLVHAEVEPPANEQESEGQGNTS
jgi:hypothetical protein